MTKFEQTSVCDGGHLNIYSYIYLWYNNHVYIACASFIITDQICSSLFHPIK